MRPDYIFIVGVAKCGTTALAGWLVRNGLATYAVSDEKEPDSYVGTPFNPPRPPAPGSLPLLDASVAYFANQQVITRLPGHATRILVCLRNPLERLWSDYRMKKMIARQAAGYDHFLSRLHDAAGTARPDDKVAWYMARREKRLRCFPRSMARTMGAHFDAETRRLVEGTFRQRLDYELAFFSSRHQYPFQSVLRSSFFYRGLSMLLDKYQPEDITPLTVSSLQDRVRRSQLTGNLGGQPVDTPALDFTFTLGDVDFDEPAPDFSAPCFDGLRRLFAYDLEQALALLRRSGTDTGLVDVEELHRHIR